MLKYDIQKDTVCWKARPGIPASLGEPGYMKTVVGHSVLTQFLKCMLDTVGINSTKETNHSLRSTAISHMSQSSVACRESGDGEVRPIVK